MIMLISPNLYFPANMSAESLSSSKCVILTALMPLSTSFVTFAVVGIIEDTKNIKEDS